MQEDVSGMVRSSTSDFRQRFVALQNELKAPKSKYNKFGKYNYRSAEDILEGVKPLLRKYNMVLTISDSIEAIGNRIYVKATATVSDCLSDQNIYTSAYAREADSKKGMDESQITGTASSYARKYCMNGLFCLDDTEDADTDAYTMQQQKQSPKDDYDDYPEYPTETEVKALLELADQKGFTRNQILAAGKCRSFRDMSMQAYMDIFDRISSKPDVKKGNLDL